MKMPGMRQGQYVRLVEKAKNIVQQMTAYGIGAAFVYGTRDGLLRAHGHSAITQVICENRVQIVTNEAWLEEDGGNQDATTVMYHPLGKRLSETNNKELRTILTACVRQHQKGWGQPKWGEAGHRPEWWSADIPWRNVKSGVTADQMRHLVECCYQHHGAQLYQDEDPQHAPARSPIGQQDQQDPDPRLEPSPHRTPARQPTTGHGPAPVRDRPVRTRHRGRITVPREFEEAPTSARQSRVTATSTPVSTRQRFLPDDRGMSRARDPGRAAADASSIGHLHRSGGPSQGLANFSIHFDTSGESRGNTSPEPDDPRAGNTPKVRRRIISPPTSTDPSDQEEHVAEQPKWKRRRKIKAPRVYTPL